MKTEKETAIAAWLVSYVADLMDIAPATVGVDTPLVELGMDSTAAVCLSGDLAVWLGVELEAELVFNHPSITQIARHVAGRKEALHAA